MKILVTGGAGFIGSNFINYLLQETSHYIVNIDKLTYAGSLDSINKSDNYEFIKADISDSHSINSIINLHFLMSWFIFLSFNFDFVIYYFFIDFGFRLFISIDFDSLMYLFDFLVMLYLLQLLPLYYHFPLLTILFFQFNYHTLITFIRLILHYLLGKMENRLEN